MIRVGVIGYGTIGRRVADAVAAQPDMELVGVSKARPDYKTRTVAARGYALFAPDEAAARAFEEAGYRVAGTQADLLAAVDVVVDCTPAGTAGRMKPLYEAAGVKAVFQGGEKPEIAGVSFTAQVNYNQARGQRFVRVVSCNTTGLNRVLHAVHRRLPIARARVVLARKATDSDDPDTGPVDAVVLDPPRAQVPAKHGADIERVTGVPAVAMAFRIPNVRSHFHSLLLTFRDPSATAASVVEALEAATRVVFVDSREGIASSAQVVDWARELGRSRGDLYEVAVWRDSIAVEGGEAYFFMHVHMEAIVVPENVDAVRAVASDWPAEESIRVTNRTLGILK
ncbi:MAG TPA: type II glyceraldehyde-3-phosphate dehydrogenase [Thermodesulfobacteriota bacterium]|nr:type II glyceraldehyde-3-phosphate dehydrogenase [Thermodesulfobacteriota bacterium]